MNSELAIKVENISKMYRLGQVGTGTLSHDLKRWWALKRGLEDPYLKIGAENDRSKKSESEYAYALRNVSFEVNKGDVLGVIGSNGAGKSTLLKILSRVTSPTEGEIRIKGRVASLLEVGTGFHPEMTGRENIYMNGAILGMTKKEINRKFDDIVEFAGVARYVDTPVKRYSSGMYVRLAFAVAAHLESEILIVDEVLAVGDFEFQKKCLSKMDNIAKNDGRTVLFVSHNLPAVQNLCNKAISLRFGQLKMSGEVNDVVADYLKKEEAVQGVEWTMDEKDLPKKRVAYIRKVVFMSEYEDSVLMGRDLVFNLNIQVKDDSVQSLRVLVSLYTNDENLITTMFSTDFQKQLNFGKGDNLTTIRLKRPNLLPGSYYASFQVRHVYAHEVLDTVNFAIKFTMAVDDVTGVGVPFYSDRGLMWLNADYSNVINP